MPRTKPTMPLTGKIPEHLPASDIVVLAQVAAGKEGISGKDIDKALDSRGARNWADVGSSSVYNCLSRLEMYTYVKGEQSKREGHEVKLYYMTQMGAEVLKKELIYRLSTPKIIHDELDISIAHLPLLKKQDVLNALESYMELVDEGLQYAESFISPMKQFGLLLQNSPSQRIADRTIADIDPRDVELILALLERPYRELRSKKQWLREFIEKVKDGYVWCADQQPKVQAIAQDKTQRDLEQKRKERGKKGILI
ncbi:MAG: helix-turn-helix transcriptional regulator [Candidatus Atabeyarchaeum deiterrae]